MTIFPVYVVPEDNDMIMAIMVMTMTNEQGCDHDDWELYLISQ